MQARPYRINGRVVDARSQEGIAGLRVVVWDKDWPQVIENVPPELLNDRLGSAITNEEGNFQIEFDESRFRDYTGEEGPDLFYEIYDGDQLVKTTERAVRQDVATREIDVYIEVDASRLGQGEVPSAPQGVIATAGDANVEVRWREVPEADSYNLYWTTEPDVTPSSGIKIVDVTSPFTHSDLANATTYYYVVTAVNENGESDPSRSSSATPEVLKGRVPPVDRTVGTTVESQTEFLYTGDDPLQKEVEPETIEIRRAAGIRGEVRTRDGEPLSDVTVRIQEHPEFGYTTTRSDGMFDMAVNGGEVLTIRYEMEGFVSAQRKVASEWQGFTRVPDVVLLREDTATTTTVDLTKQEPQVARGNSNEDDNGVRQPTVLFPASLSAPVTDLEVQISEFTIGPNGPSAMPDRLPPNVAYTYAVDIQATVDEETRTALAASNAIKRPFANIGMSQNLELETPVFHYVENFLGFPVGGIVPVGYYDYGDAAWIPSENGRVVEVHRIQNGLADLDVDGNGQPADPAALEELGVTEDERREVARLYDSGQELWRVPISRLSPRDTRPANAPQEKVSTSSAGFSVGGVDTGNLESGESAVRFDNAGLAQETPVQDSEGGISAPWDCNWPFKTPDGSEDPNQDGPETDEHVPDSCTGETQ